MQKSHIKCRVDERPGVNVMIKGKAHRIVVRPALVYGADMDIEEDTGK